MNLPELSRESSLPLHIQLLDDLRQQIMTGALKAHERLPSEWEIVTELGISRATIQRAWQAAQQEGLIYRVAGRAHLSVSGARKPARRSWSGWSCRIFAAQRPRAR